jgi:hypothetical protein
MGELGSQMSENAHKFGLVESHSLRQGSNCQSRLRPSLFLPVHSSKFGLAERVRIDSITTRSRGWVRACASDYAGRDSGSGRTSSTSRNLGL